MFQNSSPQHIDIPLEQLLSEDRRLLALTNEALENAALRAGEHLVCHPGCNQCCHGAFAISALDALRLRLGMNRLAANDPALAQAVAVRAETYRERHRHDFPGDPETGILGTSPEQESAFADFADDEPCPALNPLSGHCDLYESRPMTCRTFGPPVRHASEAGEGFAVCELCFTEAFPEEIEQAEMIPPFAEEHALLAHLSPNSPETIVAWCLKLPGDQPIAA